MQTTVLFSPSLPNEKELLTTTYSCNLIGLLTFGQRTQNLLSLTRPYLLRLHNNSKCRGLVLEIIPFPPTSMITYNTTHTLTCCSATCCIGVAKSGKAAVSRTEVLVVFVAFRVGGRAQVVAESSAGELECTLLRVTTCMCGRTGSTYSNSHHIYTYIKYTHTYIQCGLWIGSQGL